MTEILGPDGRPARKVAPRKVATKSDGRCPHCRAPKSQRVTSGGFGAVSEICGGCGKDVEGDTK